MLTWFRKRLNRESGAEVQTVTFASSFSGDLAVDSLDLVEIIIDLESDFDVEITGDNALAIDTVGDAICYVRRFRSDVPPLQIANVTPRQGLLIAPAGLWVKLSKIFTRIRRPR